MDISILPADMLNLKIRVRKNGSGLKGEIAIPPSLIRKYNLEDKEEIIMAYLCKGNQDLKQPTTKT